MIDGLVQAGLECDQIRLVVNRGEEAQSWPLRDLNKMFGMPVYADLPSASKDLHDACIERRLPGENTRIRKEVARLARRLAGLPEPSLKRSLSSFFPLGNTF